MTLQLCPGFPIRIFQFILAILLYCVGFHECCYAQHFERDGNIITYHGNKFEMVAPNDTINYTDPASGSEYMKVIHYDTMAVSMNGHKVYARRDTAEKIVRPQSYPGQAPEELYLLKGLSGILIKLPDGVYSLFVSLVIDEKGKAVFYRYGFLSGREFSAKDKQKGEPIDISADIKNAIIARLDVLLPKAPKMIPASVNGTAVCADTYMEDYRIKVSGHKVSFVKG